MTDKTVSHAIERGIDFLYLLERELRVKGTTRASQRSPQILSAKEKGAILLA